MKAVGAAVPLERFAWKPHSADWPDASAPFHDRLPAVRAWPDTESVAFQWFTTWCPAGSVAVTVHPLIALPAVTWTCMV